MSSQKIKIAVFGDSISEGIGSRRLNYCKPLEERLAKAGIQASITNYAFSGTTVQYMEKLQAEYEKEKYDFAIIAYGSVDAMLRPNTQSKLNLYAHIPERYRKTGMLNPRPYFSRRWYKSIIQHMDSWIRWNMNAILLNIQGSMTWVSPDDFLFLYQKAVHSLQKYSEHVILLSTVRVSDKYFPGTNKMYRKYNGLIEEISEKNEKCSYIDLYRHLDSDSLFYKDIFHPNEVGYRVIANLVAEVIEKTIYEG